MSWLWLLPPVVFAAGAVAIAIVLRGTAEAARGLAGSAADLRELQSSIASLRAEMTAFTEATTEVGRRQGRRTPGIA